MTDEADFPGPYYRLCTNRDTCPAAYAYWKDPPVKHYHFLGSPTSPGKQDTSTCRAMRWDGTPQFLGFHQPHNFTYGPRGMYVGHCAGVYAPE